MDDLSTPFLSKAEFYVLSYLALHPHARSQRAIAKSADISLGAVNAAVKVFLQNDYICEDYTVTASGYQALMPYKVKNAVIMAAGLSSRFVPLSYEKPKGLLKVRGQVLIERQIEQLLAAGITEIYVVVGYMKELFFYLEEKYNVKIVINNDFALRNNNGSIYKVREYLDNTYILSSDNYFTENVFEPYVYRSFYAVEYMSGPSSERGVKTTSSGRIIKTFPNAADCWFLTGHVYWSRKFSQAFIKCLTKIYDQPGTAPLLWERVFDMFLNHLPPLYIRKYFNVIKEFDSLDDVRSFDSKYLENLESDIVDNISSVLNCPARDLTHFEPMKCGQTNSTFMFSAGEQKYVYRHCSHLTLPIVDREREAQLQKIAARLDLDRTCIALDPERGWKISKFVDGTSLDFAQPHMLDKAIHILHQLHDSREQCVWRFDFRSEIGKIHHLITTVVGAYYDYSRLRETIDRLLNKVEAENWPMVLCHNDINRDNFIVSNRIDLIDWEYAGMNDAAYDVAKLILKTGAKSDAARSIISRYYGRPCTDDEYRHIIACGAIEDYYWFTWSIYLEKHGRNFADASYIWHKNAVEYGQEAAALYGL